VPVLTAEALNNVGIDEIFQAVESHRSMLESTGQLSTQRREQLKKELLQAIEQGVSERLYRLMEKDETLIKLSEKVGRGEIDPYSTAVDILSNQAMLKDWLSKLNNRR